MFSEFAGENIDYLHYSILNEEEYEIEADKEHVLRGYGYE